MDIRDTPTNVSLLKPTAFRFTLQSAPNLNFFTQRVRIPGLTLNPATQLTPFVNIPKPGDKVQFELMNITFLQDEDMEAWSEIYNWIMSLGRAKGFASYADLVAFGNSILGTGVTTTANLLVLTGAGNPNKEFTFYDVWPTSLSGIDMEVTDTESMPINADAGFAFSYYDVRSI